MSTLLRTAEQLSLTFTSSFITDAMSSANAYNWCTPSRGSWKRYIRDESAKPIIFVRLHSYMREHPNRKHCSDHGVMENVNMNPPPHSPLFVPRQNCDTPPPPPLLPPGPVGNFSGGV
eukprot:GHVU01190954.1.p1 GENE.GHVU01190954.1~~GHVU01190954.1.p1  ORF type:complete len:118 (-),score=5.60 GHVU01190954.1:11-364(-)